jgi:predicted O-methyltransferase YrrM
MANPVSQALRAMDGCSLAAMRKLVTEGEGAARAVVSATLAAANPRRVPAMLSLDIVRAFPVQENPVIYAGAWTSGCTTPLERFLIAQLLRYFHPDMIVEVGTFRGETTRLILDNSNDSARVCTIDLPIQTAGESVQAATDLGLIQHRMVGEAFVGHARAAQMTQVFGDTFDPGTWERIPNGVQFAFIDASHSYDAVRNDTEQLWPKLTPDAVVIWHDYTDWVSPERGVGKYLRERMLHEKDIFICPETSLGFRIPLPILTAALDRVPSWFPAGHYNQLHPHSAAPWLQT